MAEKTKEALKITRKMTLGEAVTKYPKTAEVMMAYGLHCIGCHVAAWESIEDGARGHGLTDQKIDEMVEEMNKKVK
jgi:hybrid cluster-associated redox disulfide protein